MFSNAVVEGSLVMGSGLGWMGDEEKGGQYRELGEKFLSWVP